MGMVYRVDYLIKNKDEFSKSNVSVPTYVVAEDFETALKAARKFESDNVALYECAVALNNGFITVARGYTGLVANKATVTV